MYLSLIYDDFLIVFVSNIIFLLSFIINVQASVGGNINLFKNKTVIKWLEEGQIKIPTYIHMYLCISKFFFFNFNFGKQYGDILNMNL